MYVPRLLAHVDHLHLRNQILSVLLALLGKMGNIVVLKRNLGPLDGNIKK